MATSNDQLTTISYGLTRIAEELIAEREFDSSKITLFGNPSVSTTGILSSLSETQGASYEGLSFTESDVVLVSIEGTIGELSTSELSQCLWSFKSTNDSNLTVYLDENSMTVSFKNSSGTQRSILTKDDISVNVGDGIQVKLELSSSKAKLNCFVGGSLYTEEASLEEPVMVGMNEVLIGNDSTESDNYWRGSIQLARFTISKNGSLYYSPSDDVYFEFSKVLVGDGTYPLTDNSGQVNRRVYSFPVEEIARSGSNLLLKTTVDKSADLTIREVGLYIDVKGSPKLFSVIRDLNIRKDTDLGYELIFHLNIDLSIVNTNVVPDVVFEDVHNVSKNDFLDVKTYTLGMISDMEVAVAKNATELGYNKAQVFYRYANELKINKECWLAAQEYQKLKWKIKEGTFEVFDPSSVEIHGNLEVDRRGAATNFSGDNYVVLEV